MRLVHRRDDTRHGRGPENGERQRRDAEAYGREDDPERFGPEPEVERKAPQALTHMPKTSWWAVSRGTLKEFMDDELIDRAASLTYYGILSMFPALLVLVSLLGIAGQSATKVLANVEQLTPGAARDVIRNAVQQLQGHGRIGSVIAIGGLVLAVWSASAYVAAFIRTSNAVYDIPEGRPVWKVMPLRLALTVLLMILAVVSALIVIFTGSLAQQAGKVLGIEDTVITVWSIAKWPVLAFLVSLMIAILYWASPNAKVRGFRWITPGSFLALVIWLIASAGFALYVANFASYNKTYGSFAGVIVFLVWLWITNIAILLGLEFDAETSRQRAVVGGHPPREEPYVNPRDTRKWDEDDRRRLE
ncbi:YihY/virulence factor BrkB family protein [Streptomyces sp. NPDC006602]|uniref:YihY/virulence factor BrkB family protein n=1 Tax=Streptomyces sp. NPDC006602 TaxID=3364751 RepID=UPI00368F7F67